MAKPKLKTLQALAVKRFIAIPGKDGVKVTPPKKVKSDGN